MSGDRSTAKLPEDGLIARAVAGDKNALVVLLYRYYDALAANVRSKLPAGGRVDVEDVLQQTFCKAFQHISGFRSRGPHGFYYWLKTIADRTCIDELRKRRRRRECQDAAPSAGLCRENGDSSSPRPPIVGPVNHETPSQVAGRREAALALREALETLQPRQREAVSLVFLEDLTLDQAAARMGTTRAAVHSLVYRGLEKLEEALGPMSDYLSRT